MELGERMRLRTRVLGDIAVDGPGARPLAGPTQRRAFAVLVVHRNETTTIDQLVDACWPDGDTPKRAEHNVRTYVHRLRSALGDHGDRIDTTANGYRLRVHADETDADRFEQLAAEAGRLVATGDLSAALDRIDEAESLWRGRPYAEFAEAVWAEAEVARLDEGHLRIRERQADALLQAGRPGDAVGGLEQLVRDKPYRERPRALLMRALYESGRQAEALRAFQDFRRFLIDDAGVEPSPNLVDLDRQIASGTLDTSTTRTVGNYELHERIGEGAFAVVHRATQTSLGREVAVKIVRAELANQPEFIRRFEAEAQMVASIEHSNVVPLYDYWREPGNAFLVMRWMTGGSLETRLDAGPLDLDTVVEIVDQIAAALDAAHAREIVHRDVKPANVLFDDAGRAYLGDFGIALAADERSTPRAALSEGSTVFASPEQLRREPAGPEADVHALGILALAALLGRTPFHDAADDADLLRRQLGDAVPAVSALRQGLPAALDDAIGTATAKRARDRFPTAGAFASAFRAAAAGRAPGQLPRAVQRSNPYLGLRAFTEVDVATFHGRRRLVDELVDACAETDRRMLAVVGPSGSGKSSAVRAGLVPALRSGRLPGSESWFVTTMLPGAHPYEALETALLRVASNPPSALLDQLRDGERGIHRGVSRILPGNDCTLLVVIDQFEELFTATDETERRRFLRALATAVTEPAGSLRVVATMRADFYDQPLRYPEFARVFKHGAVAITPLAPDELEEVITAPVTTLGMAFEPGLVAEIIADVNSQPGALPLLQYALTQTFDATDDDTITIATYHAVGGLTGALTRRAESLYEEAAANEQDALRRLVGRLVTLGDGTEDTRRRLRRSELPTDPATDCILDRYGAARLLTFDKDAATREPTIEIAHEALLREWPRLRTWLDDDRDALRIHRHLTTATTAWDTGGRDPNELYRGARLEAAESLLRDPNISLNEFERNFVEASALRRDADAEAERSRVRRLRRLVTATALIAVSALVTGTVALVQWNRANDEAAGSAANAALAEQNALEAESSARLADLERIQALARDVDANDPTVALLLAIEAHRADPTPRTLGLIHNALTGRAGRVATFGNGVVTSITLVADGTKALVNSDATLELWDLAERTREAAVAVDVGDIKPELLATSSMTRDGRFAVLSAGVGGTYVVEIETGDVTLLESTDLPLDPFLAPISMAVHDESSIASGTFDGSVTIWDSAGDVVTRVDRTNASPPRALTWSDDGERLAIGGDDGLVEIWNRNVATIESVSPPPGPSSDPSRMSVSALLFSSDGTRVVVARGLPDELTDAHVYRGIEVIDTADGATVVPQITDGYVRRTLAWSDLDESKVMAAATIGELTEFDLVSGRADAEVLDATGLGGGLAVDPSTEELFVAARVGVEVRSYRGSMPLLATARHTAAQQAVADSGALAGGYAFDDDSDDFAYGLVGLEDGSPRAFTVRVDRTDPSADSAPYLAPDGIEPFVQGAGQFTAIVDHRGITVRFGLDGAEVGPPIPLPTGYQYFVLSPAGDRVVIHTFDDLTFWSGMTLWDTASGELIADLDPPPAARFATPTSMFSIDGTALFGFNGLTHRSYDVQTGETVATYDDAGYATPWGDARIVADRSGDIRIIDGGGQHVGPDLIGHTRQVLWMLVSPDGTKLASTSYDGTTRVWDLATGGQLGRPIANIAARIAGWSPDSRTLAVPLDQGIQLWNYDADTWPEIACDVAGRNLTRAEWDRLGPRDVEYRATCDQYLIEE